MRSLIVLSALLFAGCGAIVAPKPVNNPVPINHAQAGRAGVVFLGDSVSARWPLDTYFPGKNYVDAGIGGQTTAQILARLPDVLSGAQTCTSITGVAPFTCQSITPPATVMIFAGWNDILGGLDMNQAAANIRGMILLCQQAGVTPIVSTVYRFDSAFGDGSDLNFDEDVIDQSIRTSGVTYIDLEALFQGQSGYTVDGVHPNPAGYAQMQGEYNLVLPR